VIALAAPVFSQTASDNSSKDSGKKDDVSTLKQQVAEQQKEIEQLRSIVNQMKQKLDQTPAAATAKVTPTVAAPAPTAPAPAAAAPAQTAAASTPNLGEVASTSPILPKAVKSSASGDETLIGSAPIPSAAVRTAAQEMTPKDEGQASPLQLHIGTASITPIGFMDFTSVFRTHAAGGSIGTSFSSIPYGTTSYQANLSEVRLSMQNSRIGFRVDADVKGAHVIGYMEADFLGPLPNNVAVSSNSSSLRSRLYWVDVARGNWEILGGQTWSLITPSAKGISPLPGDLFFCSALPDVNYNLGLFWGRIPELRFVYHHPSNKAAFAIALDSPDQYAGGSAGGPLITLPANYNTSSAYQGELDYNQNVLNAPNLAPDVIAKLALDPSKRFHLDIGGVERSFKLYAPTIAATSTTAAVPSATFTTVGGGGFLNLHVDVAKGFRLLTNNFWSDGGGRYIFGQAPDLIAHANGSISLIHASSTVTGFEYTNKKTMIYGYYGGLYIGRNVAIDTNGKPVGYGYSGAPSSQNRTVQEPTVGFNQTIWKDAKWGAVNFMGQYSYVTRNPWYVAPGQPANASLNMVFFNLRYTLPGSAPTLGR
jgi:uncharacterized coiled-coil protein SlyX